MPTVLQIVGGVGMLVGGWLLKHLTLSWRAPVAEAAPSREWLQSEIRNALAPIEAGIAGINALLAGADIPGLRASVASNTADVVSLTGKVRAAQNDINDIRRENEERDVRISRLERRHKD